MWRRRLPPLCGALGLALCLIAGLVSAGPALAKKKQKKAGTVTVSMTSPTAIPAKASANGNDVQVSIPLTVGKKAKGKAVGWDSLSLTTTFTGSNYQALGAVRSRLIAPNGRVVGNDALLLSVIDAPLWSNTQPSTTSGPLTDTPDSDVDPCFPTATLPCPGGALQNPLATVGPPYVGTVGNPALADFNGLAAKGTWIYQVLNSSTTTTAVLNSVKIRMVLVNRLR